MKKFSLLLPLLCVSCIAPSSSKQVQVTPQRPTVSNNTQTTAYGNFELESGINVDVGDAASMPTRLKYGIDEDEEIFLDLSPLNTVDISGGNDLEGFGDLTIGMRRRVWEDELFAVGIELATKLPTGDEDPDPTGLTNAAISSGEVDFAGAVVVDHNYDLATVLTGYYQLGVIGDPGVEPNGVGNDAGIRHTLTATMAHSLNEEYGLFAEVGGIADPGPLDPLFTIFGVTRSFGPTLTLDAGFYVGLNGDAADAQFLVGLTTGLGAITTR